LGLVTTSALGARVADRDGSEPADGPAAATRPLIITAARAAVAAAGAGLAMVTMLVTAGWIAAPHPRLGLAGVLRTAAVLWLVAHHVGVQVTGAGRIGMLPLGLVLLPGVPLWWAGRAVVRDHIVTGPRQLLVAAVAVAVPYAVLAGVLALASRSALAAASLPQAVVAGFAVAVVAAGLGAARAFAPWAQVGALLSARTRSALAGSAAILAVMAAAGTLATAMALASHLRQFSAVYGLLNPGLVGAGLLLLAQLAYLPNAMIWGIAYMLGPGFAVGTGTVIAPTGSVLGPLPAFPLLAAVPSGAHGSGPGWLAAGLLAVPYLAGAIGGLLVARLAPTRVLEAAPVRGFCSGALAGAVLGVLAAFAGGPLGDGRMSAVGPSAWQVAIVAALELGISAAVVAGAANWWYVRRHVIAETEPPSSSGPARSGPGVRSAPGQEHAGSHVIYLDRWAADQDEPAPPRRSGGPADLP
jgi:hypothetical protein